MTKLDAAKQAANLSSVAEKVEASESQVIKGPKAGEVLQTIRVHLPTFLETFVTERELQAGCQIDDVEVRFGTNGSLSINNDENSDNWGSFKDFESNASGGPIELIMHLRDCTKDEAWWLARNFVSGKEIEDAPEPISKEEREERRRFKLDAKIDEGRKGVERQLQWLSEKPFYGPLKYLKSRELRIRKKDGGLPECVRIKKFSPKAKTELRKQQAVVFVATDSEGRPQALQHIFVDKEGIKVITGKPGKATTGKDGLKERQFRPQGPKVTDGCLHGAAVRFIPKGLDASSPLVLVEGPEDGLSVYIAGYECWAALGIGNMRTQVLPKDRQIVIFADSDPEDAQAVRTLDETMKLLVSTGHKIRVARVPADLSAKNEAGEEIKIKDANDLLIHFGKEEIVKAIEAAEGPDLEGVEVGEVNLDEAESEEADELLAQIEAEFPLPELPYPYYAKYGYHESIPWVIRCEEKDDDFTVKIPLWTPWKFSHRIEYVDQDRAAGNRITLRSRSGVVKTVDFMTSETLDKTFHKKVISAGVLIAKRADGHNIFTGMAGEANPESVLLVVNRPGWRDGSFVTPLGVLIGDTDSISIELDDSVKRRFEPKKGTIEGQIAAFDAALKCGNPHLALGIYSGYAGAVLELIGYPSSALVFTGETSKGKSTAQRLGASVFSDPYIDRGLLKTVSTTANGVEAVFELGNGTSIHLEELSLMGGSAFQDSIFKLSSGSGKIRLNQDSSLQRTRRWITFGTFSGETGMVQKVQSEGATAKGGLDVRALEIGVDGALPLTKEVLQAIDGINQNCGHTGPVFVRHLIEMGYAADPSRLRIEIEERAEALAGRHATPAKARAAKVLAVLQRVSELARDAGLIDADYDVSESIKWAWQSILDMETDGRLDVTKRAINAFSTSLLTDPRIKSIGEETESSFQRPVGWYDSSKYYIMAESIDELAGNFITRKQLIKELECRGALIGPEGKSREKTVQYVPKDGHHKPLVNIRCYVIPISFVREKADREPSVGDESPEDVSPNNVVELEKSSGKRRKRRFN